MPCHAGSEEPMTDRIHVVIVDDHPLFREGVSQTLAGAPDIEVLAEGGSADEAVRLVSDLLPDILLLDIDIPGGGLIAAQAVASRSPVTKIVMLTVSEEEDNLVAALRAGARAVRAQRRFRPRPDHHPARGCGGGGLHHARFWLPAC